MLKLFDQKNRNGSAINQSSNAFLFKFGRGEPIDLN